jgi:alcohol dehydrogenase class IV
MQGYNIHKFSNPTEIVYGTGSIRQLASLVEKEQAKKVLVITDPGVWQAGLVQEVETQLHEVGIEYEIFAEVEPNPSVDTVEKAFQQYCALGADMIIAMGGGSAIDVGKAVGVLATNGGTITQYEGIDTFTHSIAPLLAIPTTAGTGSEVTLFTVITDTKRDYKLTVGGRKLAPAYAIVDPALTLTMPRSVTASTGLDALVHAIESYTSLAAYPLSETLALEAIRVISANLRQAVFNGANLAARENMLYGSLVAGMAFNNTRLGNVHAMSHPVSAMFKVAHGVANSILLPHVMEFNVYAVPEKFRSIAEAMGYRTDGLPLMEAAKLAITAVKELAADIGIPSSLRDVGVREDAIPQMAQDAMKSGNIAVNPRKTTEADIRMLFEKAMGQAESLVEHPGKAGMIS